MKASNGIVATVAAVFVASTLLAESFSTDCVSLYGLRNNSDLTVRTDITYSQNMSQIYIGKINSFHGGTFLAARLPSGAITNATVYMAIDSGGTITDANVDIWSMGFYDALPSSFGRAVSSAWLTYDDSSPVYANGDGSYTYLNGHAPVKISDDAVPIGTQVSKGTLKLPVPELLTEMGLAFNRGATTNGYIFLRFNTDAAPLANGFYPAGYSTEVADGDESKSATRIFYSALDGVTAPVPRLSAEERASDWYVRSAVDWVQSRDGDGAAGFSYPAYCGVKDGKTRDLIFTFNAPEYTVTNAWLTLNALPPFTGTIPSGASVKLSLLGFVDAPAANTDLLVTDAMLEGQEEVVLQENVLLYGIASGTSLLSEGLGQRNLIRALNARAKAAALANDGSVSGKKAVMRLSVTSPDLSSDWGFSIGSVATPGVEAFFECIEYRKWIDIFTNTGFEDGMTGWTISNKTYTENQISVVEDPTDPSNHCLRFWNTDTPTATLEVQQTKTYPSSFLKSVSGRPCKVSYRVYLPSTNPLTKKTSSLTEYGWYILGGFPSGSYSQMITGRACDDGSTKDKWLWTNRNPSILPDNLTSEFRMYFQFRFSTAVDADDDAMYYVDDITVKVQDFYEYPPERKGMTLILK